jgi:hypothetical protein
MDNGNSWNICNGLNAAYFISTLRYSLKFQTEIFHMYEHVISKHLLQDSQKEAYNLFYSSDGSQGYA